MVLIVLLENFGERVYGRITLLRAMSSRSQLILKSCLRLSIWGQLPNSTTVNLMSAARD